MTDSELDQILRSADPAARLAAPPPRPLTDEPVVVPIRRRSGWIPVGAAAAVLAVVGAAVVLLPSDGGGGGNQAGGPGPSPSVASKAPQREHTASAGTPYERAHRLLGTLQAKVPTAYQLPATPPDNPQAGPTSGPDSTLPTIGPDGTGMPASSFQAVRDEGPEGYAGYSYDAYSTVADDRRLGQVSARVWTGIPAGDPCAVGIRVSWNQASCTVVVTAAKQRVALLRPSGDAPRDPRESQWAVYRHPDGTVVLVGQGTGSLNDALPRLRHQVFTAAQLAALATDPAFTR